MMFQDLSFLFSASTTTYMDSPSKPIRRHSRALSSSLDLVSSGTLIKHLDPKTHKWLIDSSWLKTFSYGVMLSGRILDRHLFHMYTWVDIASPQRSFPNFESLIFVQAPLM